MDITMLTNLLKQSDSYNNIYDCECWDSLWKSYINEKEKEYCILSVKEAIHRIISEENFRNKSNFTSCEDSGVNIRVGNICYVDFGLSYINEAGYQHFGLIMSIKHGKALVIPMTSNHNTYLNANLRDHLLPIGLIKGMNRPSVLFLNDARFINTARIIDVKAYIPKSSNLFKDIQTKLFNCMM
ncbi:MAG: hypothetical protein RR646_04925 [Erysipelotrichaceae bacterium]